MADLKNEIIQIKVNDNELEFEAVGLEMKFEYKSSFALTDTKLGWLKNLSSYKIDNKNLPVSEEGAYTFVEKVKKKPEGTNAYEIEFFPSSEQFSYRYFELPDEYMSKIYGFSD
ncbi:MAG: hypothetical protein KKB03_03360 [Nanoarchaeota archaeon]|nr:hypothetical protein [Nanoarchaeota archaeon]MBU1134911.1 hypothetical protein [Nanoarchaeota archaeon]MBU2520254.1 hypothetical protein [Nanoarchaeota archaeon]